MPRDANVRSEHQNSRSRILAHRGIWNETQSKNSLDAIICALESGFGVEFDIRDFEGQLCVSHDVISCRYPLSLSKLMNEIERIETTSAGLLAINVKSDGLTALLPKIGSPHFFFDMSFPEMKVFADANFPIATRFSIYESLPLTFIEKYSVETLWVDTYDEEWLFRADVFTELLNLPLKKVFVSPELHGRDPSKFWEKLSGSFDDTSVYICTDMPFELAALL